MLIFRTVDTLQTYLHKNREKGKSIGFAPTMGALHQGHLSLVKNSKKNCDLTVVSIFVNPTQFNEASDLEKYPRTLEADAQLLISVDTDVLFAPSADEVYPKGLETSLDLDFGSLASVLEGEFRQGHFEGMAQVVNRLLDIVQPDKLFMGQKDFQQFTIVQSMLQQTNRKTELVVCPIVREEDGLAMSSRNRRLTAKHRSAAVLLHDVLENIAKDIEFKSIVSLKEKGMKRFRDEGFKPEYLEIVDAYTLKAIDNYEEHDYVVALTAVWVGDIRLIDNKILKKPIR